MFSNIFENVFNFHPHTDSRVGSGRIRCRTSVMAYLALLIEHEQVLSICNGSCNALLQSTDEAVMSEWSARRDYPKVIK